MKRLTIYLSFLLLLTCAKEDNTSLIEGYQLQISQLNSKITEYSNQVTQLQSTVNSLNSQVNTIPGLEDTITSLNAQIGELEETIESLTSEVSTIPDLNDEITSLEETIASLNEQIESLELILNPKLLSVNVQRFSNDINWNDHKKETQSELYFNHDDIPDIVAPEESNNNTIKSQKVNIIDYNNTPIYTFDIYEHYPNIRDSLPIPMVSYNDLNSDGNYDFVISYMGEYHKESSSIRFTGTKTFLWLSKGNLEFDVIELYDTDIPQFGVTTFDFDLDGFVDILPNSMQDGVYYKNINNETFVRTNIEPLYISEFYVYFDWDMDGYKDFLNIGPHNKLITIITKNNVIQIPFDNTGWNFYYTTQGESNEWSAERVSIIDGDNDGDWDIVFGGFYDEGENTYHEQKYFQNNDNQYSYIDNYIEHDHTLNNMLKVWVGDIDNDGDDDLYYPTYGEFGGKESVFWWENTNNGFVINKNFKLIY